MRGVETAQKKDRMIYWEDTLTVTKRDFHDDLSRILEVLQMQIQRPFIFNPFHPNKALLKCLDQTLARLLTLNKGWATNGPLTLKLEMESGKTRENVGCTITWRLDQIEEFSYAFIE